MGGDVIQMNTAPLIVEENGIIEYHPVPRSLLQFEDGLFEHEKRDRTSGAEAARGGGLEPGRIGSQMHLSRLRDQPVWNFPHRDRLQRSFGSRNDHPGAGVANQPG